MTILQIRKPEENRSQVMCPAYLAGSHAFMIHDAFIKQLLYIISIEDTREDQTQSLPSKSLKNYIGAELTCHFKGKGTQIGEFAGICLRTMQPR